MTKRSVAARLAVYTALVCLLLPFITPPAAAGIDDEPLPTDHWANEVIYELYAGGVWGAWPIGTRPWYRGDIRRRVAELAARQGQERDFIAPEQVWLLDKLQSEFAHDVIASDTASSLQYRIGGEPGLLGRLEDLDLGNDTLVRSRFAAFVGVGQGNWWTRIRGDIDSHGNRDPTFFGRKWKGNLTGTIDLGLFSYRKGALEILMGRDFLRWSSASHDALLLNDQSPPFDMARFQFHHRYFDFSYFVTGLDSDFASPGDDSVEVAPGVKRYLAGHRLSLRPWRTLQVGLSEVVIWGGERRQLEAYYLNPFLPYYWEQLNANHDDNPIWSLDLSYLPARGLMLYGELLIDDFQIDFVSEPHQIGGILGFNWSDPFSVPGGFLTADWTRIQQNVYGQNKAYNRYLNYRVGIGSTLGPDADRWYVRWRQHLTHSFDLTGRLIRTREGEREIDTPQNTATPYGEDFPTGIVQRTTSMDLSALYNPDAHLRAEFSAGYSWTRNAGHASGAANDGLFVQLSATLSYWRIGSL
jgi:hypothetical protein